MNDQGYVLIYSVAMVVVSSTEAKFWSFRGAVP